MTLSIHTLLRTAVAIGTVVITFITTTAQVQQQQNCGCQCTCEKCNCTKPAPKAGGHWVWVEDEVATPQRTQRSRPSTHKNEGEISLNTDNAVNNHNRKSVSTGRKNESEDLHSKPSKTDNTVAQTETSRLKNQKSQKSEKQNNDNASAVVKTEKLETKMTPEEAEILRKLTESDMSKYGLVQYIDTIARIKWIDDEINDTEQELMEFVKHQGKRYMPLAVSNDHKENAAYLYFDENADGTTGPLHLLIQYYADEHIYFNDIDFQIDYMPDTPDDRRCTYNVSPDNIQRGNVGKMTWETSDNIMSSNDNKDLLYALAHCSWAQMTIKSNKKDKINHTLILTDDQLRDFYVMLQLFRLKGGGF